MNRTYLFNTEKYRYITGEKPKVDCILCAIRDRNSDVTSLEIIRTDLSILTINLYPYNPGHLMIFPIRHVEMLGDLTDEEALDMHRVTRRAFRVLDAELHPHGYNAGYNMGFPAGGSIPHLHLHIVPRYRDETGFIDILSGERVFVMDPCVMLENLKKRFSKITE